MLTDSKASTPLFPSASVRQRRLIAGNLREESLVGVGQSLELIRIPAHRVKPELNGGAQVAVYELGAEASVPWPMRAPSAS